MPQLPANIRELYPFESHWLEIDGHRMHYVDEGSGPVVLLLHGNPTWSFYYRDLILGLRDRYRVIAPDHVGCGLSDKPQDGLYCLAWHIENLSTLIEHLDLHDITLGVHDWGGAIGLGWATGLTDNAGQKPLAIERVARLVVFNTAAFHLPRIPFRIAVCRLPILGRVAVQRFNAFARAALWMAPARRERFTDAVKAAYLFPYDTYDNRIAIYSFVQDIPMRPSHLSYSVLKDIELHLPALREKPMMICWGKQDFCFNDAFLAEWRRRFPSATVYEFANAGHYVVEDAHERILPLMRSFIAST